MWVFSILLITSSLICSCCLISLYIPWISPKITLKNGLFEVSVPIEIGLFKCFSDVCKDCSQIVKIINNEKQNISTQKTTDRDNQEEFNWNRKSLKLNSKSFNENAILEAKKPFREASLFTIPLIGLTFLTGLIAVMLCLIVQVTGSDILCIYSKFRYPFGALLLSTMLLLFTSLVYIFKTMPYLHGGSFGDAIWLNFYFVMLSLICIMCPVKFVESWNQHFTHQYTTIPDSDAQESNS